MKHDEFIIKSSECFDLLSIDEAILYYERYRTLLAIYLPEDKDQFLINNKKIMNEINLIDGYILTLKAKKENPLF